jgi:hypothetical protein
VKASGVKILEAGFQMTPSMPGHLSYGTDVLLASLMKELKNSDGTRIYSSEKHVYKNQGL